MCQWVISGWACQQGCRHYLVSATNAGCDCFCTLITIRLHAKLLKVLAMAVQKSKAEPCNFSQLVSTGLFQDFTKCQKKEEGKVDTAAACCGSPGECLPTVDWAKLSWGITLADKFVSCRQKQCNRLPCDPSASLGKDLRKLPEMQILQKKGRRGMCSPLFCQ